MRHSKKMVTTAICCSVLLMLSGCTNSSDKEAIAIAEQMCEIVKSGNVSEIKNLAHSDFHEDLDQLVEFMDFAANMNAAAIDAELEKIAEVNCKETNVIEDINKNTKKVFNPRTMQAYTLKKDENGQWLVHLEY